MLNAAVAGAIPDRGVRLDRMGGCGKLRKFVSMS